MTDPRTTTGDNQMEAIRKKFDAAMQDQDVECAHHSMAMIALNNIPALLSTIEDRDKEIARLRELLSDVQPYLFHEETCALLALQADEEGYCTCILGRIDKALSPPAP